MRLTRIFMILLLAAVGFFSSCKDEEEAIVATVNYIPSTTSAGDIGGDVGGNGGSTAKSYTWQNASTTAEYNMDITSAKGGKMQMVIKDAAGTTVLDHTLEAGVTADSKSGVTASGSAGAWTVTITLTNFNGDGSFSISQGN